MAELAEELGANDMAIHGWSLLAIMERMSGRIEQAVAVHDGPRAGDERTETERPVARLGGHLLGDGRERGVGGDSAVPARNVFGSRLRHGGR